MDPAAVRRSRPVPVVVDQSLSGASTRAYQSLRDGSLIDVGDFVGFENYTKVLTQPSFWAAARFTLIFTLVGVFGSWLIGLALAILLKTQDPR